MAYFSNSAPAGMRWECLLVTFLKPAIILASNVFVLACFGPDLYTQGLHKSWQLVPQIALDTFARCKEVKLRSLKGAASVPKTMLRAVHYPSRWLYYSKHLSRRVYDKVSFDFPFRHLRRITLHHAAVRRIAPNPRMLFCSIALTFQKLRSLGIYYSTTVSNSSKKWLSSGTADPFGKDFLRLWLLIWHIIASGTLLKFKTSHRAWGTFLLLEATLSWEPDWSFF